MKLNKGLSPDGEEMLFKGAEYLERSMIEDIMSRVTYLEKPKKGIESWGVLNLEIELQAKVSKLNVIVKKLEAAGGTASDIAHGLVGKDYKAPPKPSEPAGLCNFRGD